MALSSRLPSPRLLAQSAGIIAVAAAPVGVAWWLVEGTSALAVYLGMTYMVIAVTRMPIRHQLLVGLSVGVAAGAGTLLAGNTLLLVAATAAACLIQWRFNTWCIAAAALMPAALVKYSVLAPDQPLRIAVATWLGAAVAIGVAALARMRTHSAQPAPSRHAAHHATLLAVGCVILVLLLVAFDLQKGTWAIVTLCLLFLPQSGETTRRVRNRVLGTVAGAIVAVVVSVTLPSAVTLALAVVCGVLTVAYSFMPDDLLYVVFLTPTVLLLFGAKQPVLHLASERIAMTVVGGALAVALTALTIRLTRARDRRAPQRDLAAG